MQHIFDLKLTINAKEIVIGKVIKNKKAGKLMQERLNLHNPPATTPGISPKK